MPNAPSKKKKMFKKGIPMVLYTSDSQLGEFKAGYLEFPMATRSDVRAAIQKDPGSAVLKSGLEGAMNAFARVQNAQLNNVQFGQSLGLPAEFADLVMGGIRIQARVYVSSQGFFLFSANSDDAHGAEYFNSVKLAGEIAKG